MTALEKIRNRRREIKEQIDRLGQEDAQLDIAETVIVRLNGGSSIPAASKPVSQRDFILTALRELETPWIESSRVLREHIVTKFSVDIPINSFQPLIWTLTQKDKLIKRDGKRLALLERVA